MLSIFAGYIGITLLRLTTHRRSMRAWRALIFALVFFAIQGILGALRAFNIFSSPFLTHVVPTIVLGFLIYALALQIYTNISEK
jgi:NhaP-type Na+/H+ or K+/H+ antiporter